MKKILITIACAVGLALNAATDASALTIGDSLYVGFVDPCTPANATNEVACINALIDVAAGDTLTVGPPPNPAGITYNRTDSTIASASLADTNVTGASQGNIDANGDGTTSDVSGFTYLLAKYGTVSHVWLISGLSGSLNIPLIDNFNHGLSHYSLYNGGGVTVPDGGATLGLLGLAMLGVGWLRQRLA